MAVHPAEFLGTGMAISAPMSRQQDEAVLEFQFTRGKRSTIKDSQGSDLLVVKSFKPFALHTRRVLCDPLGKVLFRLKKKIWTLHSRWSAYHGDDNSESNRLFTMSKCPFQCGPSPCFKIFLATNETSKPDFTVRWECFGRNYTVFFNGNPVAGARQKWNVWCGKYDYRMSIKPLAEHSFVASVVALIAFVKQDGLRKGRMRRKVLSIGCQPIATTL